MTVPATKCLLVFFLVSTVKLASSDHWDYGHEGEWPSFCKKGKSQSPIALSTSSATKANFPKFKFTKWEQTYPCKVINNGHTIKVVPQVDEKPRLEGGGLVGTFLLDHLHFHWQSEHTVDKKRFALEIHFVHYSDKFKSVTDALGTKESVAVLGVLFYISPDDSDDFDIYPPIINLVAGNMTHEEQLQVTPKTLLPQDTAGFFRYPGSLTTPGCDEGLIWTVFTHQLPISERQWDTFHAVTGENHQALKDNYRPLQDLNGRIVYIKKSSLNDARIHCISVLAFVPMLLFKMLA